MGAPTPTRLQTQLETLLTYKNCIKHAVKTYKLLAKLHAVLLSQNLRIAHGPLMNYQSGSGQNGGVPHAAYRKSYNHWVFPV